MYHIGPDSEHREAPPSGPSYSDKQSFFAPSEYRPHRLDHTNHHHAHAHQHYPTSAPAVPTSSDDYFSFSVQLATNYAQAQPQLYNSQNSGVGDSKTKPLAQSPINVAGALKIRHRSNLSHSYTNADTFGHPQTLSDPEGGFPATHHQPAPAKAPTTRKSRNPGFRLQLDNLDAPNPLQRFQLQILGSPHSESSFEMAYGDMRIMDREGVHNSGNDDLNKGQDIITPLMNPPQTSENGYFGAFDGPDHSANADNAMLGGYLAVPHDPAHDQKNSDTNSEIEEYLNFPIDEFRDFYDYNFKGEGKDYGPVDHTANSALGYPRADNGARVEASFVPIMQGDNTDHYDFISQDRLRIAQGELMQQRVVQHNDQHREYAPHKHPGDSRAPDSYEQNSFKHQHYDHQHDHHQDHHHQHHQQDHHQHQHDHHNQDRHGDSRQNPFEHHQHQDTGIFSPGRPDLERSVSAPTTLLPGKMGDKKLVAKKKKTPKGTICSICDRFISRDFSRHMRIHNEVGRFQCMFPRSYCKHRSGKFNRPYDFKKHLLNMHFNFDDPSGKTAPNLTDKLNIPGQCIACGQKFIANDWLENHILTRDLSKKCAEVQRLEQVYADEVTDQFNGNLVYEEKLYEDRLIDEDYEDST